MQVIYSIRIGKPEMRGEDSSGVAIFVKPPKDISISTCILMLKVIPDVSANGKHIGSASALPQISTSSITAKGFPMDF